MAVTSLKEKLKDWTEIEEVMMEIAVFLGLLPDNTGKTYLDNKPFFWCNNPYIHMINNILTTLEESGAIECRDENPEKDIEYRWNPEFKLKL